MGGLWYLLPGSGVKMKRELLRSLLHKLKASLNPSVEMAFNAIRRLSVVTFWPPIQNPPHRCVAQLQSSLKASQSSFIHPLSAAAVLHPHAALIGPALFILHDNGVRNSIAVDLWCRFQAKRRQSKKQEEVCRKRLLSLTLV